MYNVTLSKKAIKALKKLPTEYQIRIKDGINKLSIDPFKMDLEKMYASDATHRLRIGPYRIIFLIDTTLKEIIISTIKRRTNQTYR